jgi:hypothetical protein
LQPAAPTQMRHRAKGGPPGATGPAPDRIYPRDR